MKKNLHYAWGVFYPILIYYVIAGMAFFAMTLLVGDNPEIYMLKQLVGSGATIPFLMSLWKQDVYEMQIVFGKPEQDIRRVIVQGILVVLGMAALGKFSFLGTGTKGASPNSSITAGPPITAHSAFFNSKAAL